MLEKFYKMRNKKGFTLIELLVVVAIIAIMVAIAVPVFSSSTEKAKVATDQANLRTLKSLAEMEFMSNGTTGTFTLDPVTGTATTGAITGYEGKSATCKGTEFTATVASDGAVTMAPLESSLK